MKLACSVGDISPTGAKVRNPVAWIARMEETKWVESIDKAILGMVSESQGRNESEPTSSLDKNESGGRAPSSGRRQHGMAHADRSARLAPAGWQGQHGDKGMLSNWRNRPRPMGKPMEQGRSYNR